MSAPAGEAVVIWFGTHWRSRVVAALISVALFAAGWNVARWWRARVIVRDSGQPAIVRVNRPGYDSLELFDWTTGTWQKLAEVRWGNYWYNPDAIRVVLDGKAVAWHQDGAIHVAPVDGSPVRISKPLDLSPGDRLLGLTRDEKFAIVGVNKQSEVGISTMQPIDVVDLQSGDVVISESWSWGPSPVRGSGELVGSRLSPEAHGRWRFSSDGGWKKIGEVGRRVGEWSSVTFTIDSDEQLHWLDSQPPNGVTLAPEARVACVSPLGNRFVANFNGGGCVVVDQTTGKTIRFDLPWGRCPMGSFTLDGNTLVVSDLRDDIHVIDASTGRLIAKDSAGSRRREILALIAIVGLFVGAAWLLITFLERSTYWATFDVLATTMVLALAMVGISTSVRHLDMELLSTPPQAFMILQGLGNVVVGASAGVVVMAAWYWAHGEGAIATRWAKGAMGVAILLLPYLMLDEWPSWWRAARAFTATAIFAAGLTALVVWIPNAIGWTIRNHPVEKLSHRFGLRAIFTAIASVGILLALGKWLLDPNMWRVQSRNVFGIAEMMLVGTVLVAILFSRLSWYWITAGLVLFVMAVVTLIFPGLVGMPARSASFAGIHVIQASRFIGMSLAVLITCLVLRHHGFRWTRATAPVNSAAVVPL